jgi:leucyl aminopeptidase
MAPAGLDNAFLPCQLNTVRQINDSNYDGVLVVVDSLDTLKHQLAGLHGPIGEHLKLDKRALSINTVSVINVNKDVIPSGRLIISPTGPLNRDYDDIRRFSDAAAAGVTKAIGAGVKKLLLVCPEYANYPSANLVTCLGALQSAYLPIELRELQHREKRRLELIGVWSNANENEHSRVVRLAAAIEAGRTVARDIAGSDPERMTPIRTAEYVRHAFPHGASSVKLDVIEDQATIKNEYPFVDAVNRAANVVPRHQARIIKLVYHGEGPVEETLLFVGKGVTLDTGGIDVKKDGNMVGMSRDKSGAAAVAGFFKVLDELKPKGLKVIGTLSMVRNSVGPESYTCDEILTARSGRRVRVVNTDAEGRMVMLDPLCELREQALKETNAHLFTVATLTGHAWLTIGNGYSIAMDNGPAHKAKEASKLREASESVGDMVDVSILRREDYDFHRGESEYEDLRQAATSPSARLQRGHQGPAAFIIMGSGLDHHGIDSKNPLKYTHIDMAGAEGPAYPSVPWGSPVAALTARYVIPRV